MSAVPQRITDTAERYLRGDTPRKIAADKAVTVRTVKRYLMEAAEIMPGFKLRLVDLFEQEK